MTDVTSHSPTATGSSTASSSPESNGSALVSEHGRTTIADAVVAKIAGISAREVDGVHDLGGGAARAVGALRERISGATGVGGGQNVTQGVSVEVGEREAAVDLSLVAEYGVSIVDLSDGIRRNVINAIERMTGLSVTEVNIDVQDVFLESEDSSDDDEQASPRVQ